MRRGDQILHFVAAAFTTFLLSVGYAGDTGGPSSGDCCISEEQILLPSHTVPGGSTFGEPVPPVLELPSDCVRWVASDEDDNGAPIMLVGVSAVAAQDIEYCHHATEPHGWYSFPPSNKANVITYEWDCGAGFRETLNPRIIYLEVPMPDEVNVIAVRIDAEVNGPCNLPDEEEVDMFDTGEVVVWAPTRIIDLEYYTEIPSPLAFGYPTSTPEYSYDLWAEGGEKTRQMISTRIQRHHAYLSQQKTSVGTETGLGYSWRQWGSQTFGNTRLYSEVWDPVLFCPGGVNTSLYDGTPFGVICDAYPNLNSFSYIWVTYMNENMGGVGARVQVGTPCVVGSTLAPIYGELAVDLKAEFDCETRTVNYFYRGNMTHAPFPEHVVRLDGTVIYYYMVCDKNLGPTSLAPLPLGKPNVYVSVTNWVPLP